jgi:hypothetical protein
MQRFLEAIVRSLKEGCHVGRGRPLGCLVNCMLMELRSRKTWLNV